MEVGAKSYELSVKRSITPAAITAITAITTVSAIATVSAITTATAATAATAAFARVGFVHYNSASQYGRAVEGGDSSLTLALVTHFHEAKPSGSTGLPVSNYSHRNDFTERLERLSQVVLGRLVGKLANKKIHVYSFSLEASKRCSRSARFR